MLRMHGRLADIDHEQILSSQRAFEMVGFDDQRQIRFGHWKSFDPLLTVEARSVDRASFSLSKVSG